SILGSGSIIICVMLQRLSRMPELQPLIQLSVADLLLAVCWLIGAVLYSQRCNSFSTHCYNLHTVEQILYMASFLYTLNYMWNLYKGIREKFYSCLSGYSVQVHTCSTVALRDKHLFPVLLMTPVLIKGNISHCQANFSEPYRCLLMHTGALYLNSEHRPMMRPCSMLHHYRISGTDLVTVLVIKARSIYRRVVASNGYLGNEQRVSFRVMDRRMVLYPLIFVLCWGPAVILAFLRLLKPSAGLGDAGVVLYISQAVTSASQGFLNCVVYGWTSVHLRRAGRTVLSRDVNTQTPLLRAQKARSYSSLRTVG
uniref:Transmembrane protein 116 n=1 Tax=Acanthochromis polyacanthus TaxID=80966 RepID=A0A3Q1EI80_9TELE